MRLADGLDHTRHREARFHHDRLGRHFRVEPEGRTDDLDASRFDRRRSGGERMLEECGQLGDGDVASDRHCGLRVEFDDFGEGSFDKGIRITIPITWVTGSETRDQFSTTIRPVLRDGGARLNVPNRLYETVRPYHSQALGNEWGRFWR